MRVWVIESGVNRYLDSNSRIVSFGCSRTFKSEKTAKGKISKLEAKGKYPIGALKAVCKNVSEIKRYSVEEMINELNAKNQAFVEESYNYKMVAHCKHGFMNAKYRGYHTLEERFSGTLNKAAVYKTFPELYAHMQINKAFVQIPADHLVKMWVTAGEYKDEVEGSLKLAELVSLLEGKDMEVCFIG